MVIVGLLWIQCEPAMQDKIKTLTGYEVMRDTCDSITLLKAIREVTFMFESQRYRAMQVHEMHVKFALLRQGRTLTNSQYLEKFSNTVETMEACGVTIGYSAAMVNAELAALMPPKDTISTRTEEYSDATKRAKDKYLAAAFIASADINRFGSMLETLENDCLRGDKECYPFDLNKAYDLLSNWKSDPKNISRILEDNAHDGVSFNSNRQPAQHVQPKQSAKKQRTIQQKEGSEI